MGRVSRNFVVVIVGISVLFLAACENSSTPVGTPSTPKQGVALVDKLSDDEEGVILEDGYLKLKPGYKFEEQKDGTVTVARMADGSPVGSKKCECEDDLGNKGRGTCNFKKDDGAVGWCDRGTCNKSCTMWTKLPDGTTLRILKY